jgi:hypothetical protein
MYCVWDCMRYRRAPLRAPLRAALRAPLRAPLVVLSRDLSLQIRFFHTPTE